LTETPVEFRWRPVSGADNYRFRLYRVNGEDTLLRETDTEGALSVSVPIAPGNYRWAVQAVNKAGIEGMERTGYTAEQRFSARDVAFVSLVSPVNGVAVARNAQPSDLSARWTTTEPLRASRFILSRNPDPLQGTPVMDIRNPVSPLALPRSLNEGTYYWTVLAETTDNYTASARTPARFQVLAPEPITLASPANGAQIPFAEARAIGLVRWTSAERPARSRFILSANPNPLSGTPIVDVQNPPPAISLPELPPGDYYWTITGTTSEGLDIGARPSMFRILPRPPLSAVRPLAPINGETIRPETLRESRRVIFRWEAVEGANEYVFTLWKDGNVRETLVTSRPTTGTSMVFDDLARLAEGGTFVWQVTACYRDRNGRVERQSAESESRFTIDFPRPARGQAHQPGILYGRENN
jgi:hypothetical protein